MGTNLATSLPHHKMTKFRGKKEGRGEEISKKNLLRSTKGLFNRKIAALGTEGGLNNVQLCWVDFCIPVGPYKMCLIQWESKLVMLREPRLLVPLGQRDKTLSDLMNTISTGDPP